MLGRLVGFSFRVKLNQHRRGLRPHNGGNSRNRTAILASLVVAVVLPLKVYKVHKAGKVNKVHKVNKPRLAKGFRLLASVITSIALPPSFRFVHFVRLVRFVLCAGVYSLRQMVCFCIVLKSPLTSP